MSATSPLGAAGALGIALLTVTLLQRRFGVPAAARRFSTLDGLRGYAAFLVYLHHCAIWYFFARTGVWTLPPTRLYIHFGQSSVAIFFMITGFLFWSKVLDARDTAIDWRRLYVSRVLRLAPLFALFVALLWVIALATNGFHLRISVPRAAVQTLQWMTFTVAGMPDLNFAPTSLVGGPAWSLPYEWWFYLSLPLTGVLVGLRPTRLWLILGLAGAVGGAWWVGSRGSWPIAATFLGGIASAFLVRHSGVRAAARHPIASIACLTALGAVTRFGTAFAPAPLLLLSLAFAIIACGNTLFGALEWPPARGLGDMGYSVYLLHGVILFAAFGLLLGPAKAAALSAAGHWLVVNACAVVVTLVSAVTFHVVEAPAMRSVDRVNALMAP
ncbi:MAG: acyltransferase family protein [Vicinamibacterales bacterium]